MGIESSRLLTDNHKGPSAAPRMTPALRIVSLPDRWSRRGVRRPGVPGQAGGPDAPMMRSRSSPNGRSPSIGLMIPDSQSSSARDRSVGARPGSPDSAAAW